MAGDPEKPHFSKAVLNTSERAQRMLGKIGAPLVNMVTGSSFSEYVQLQWAKQPHLNPEDFEWCEVPGDPDAGLVPRFWKKAAVLGVSVESYHSAWRTADTDKDGSRLHERMLQAVAYEAEGTIRIGTRQGNRTFQEFGVDHVWTDTIAMRLGRGPLKATMGLWFPDRQELVIPDGVRVLEAALPIEDLADAYPYTRLT